MEELAKEAAVKVGGRWRILRAVLVKDTGGRRVVYFDADGNEAHSEPYYKSQFHADRK